MADIANNKARKKNLYVAISSFWELANKFNRLTRFWGGTFKMFSPRANG